MDKNHAYKATLAAALALAAAALLAGCGGGPAREVTARWPGFDSSAASAASSASQAASSAVSSAASGVPSSAPSSAASQGDASGGASSQLLPSGDPSNSATLNDYQIDAYDDGTISLNGGKGIIEPDGSIYLNGTKYASKGTM